MSRNLRTALIFGGFISLIGAAFYPIYFRPLMRLEEYRNRNHLEDGRGPTLPLGNINGHWKLGELKAKAPCKRSAHNKCYSSRFLEAERFKCTLRFPCSFFSSAKTEMATVFCLPAYLHAPCVGVREGTSYKSGWNCSRGCAATRVKSVV
ncbi:small integral membrane protein 20 isoform X1 [Symphalangus syndactylus]|uniref:small integral membrane protein 20 isoform X1 n=1 Tax=Symphalangus syndactylus TaxID=9590 RepID=UPI0030069289